MPVYTYRREDGTTFEIKQRFLDDPLQVDPETGQHVVRIVQPAGIIFKGSGFYVNDSKNASKASLASSHNGSENGNGHKAESSNGNSASSENKTKPVSNSTSSAASSAAD